MGQEFPESGKSGRTPGHVFVTNKDVSFRYIMSYDTYLNDGIAIATTAFHGERTKHEAMERLSEPKCCHWKP
jgi:hypothetical protein